MTSTTEPKLISFNELIGKRVPSHDERVRRECDKKIDEINRLLLNSRYAGMEKIEMSSCSGINPSNQDLIRELDGRLRESGYRTFVKYALDYRAQKWVCESFQVMLTETAKPTPAHLV